MVKGKYMRVLTWAAGVTGTLGDASGYQVYGENRLKVTQTMAATETIRVYGKIESGAWTLIGTLIGTGAEVATEYNIRTWDYIKYDVFASVAGGSLFTSAFFNQGSADTFLDLDDTPSSFSGQASKVLTVKGDESGVEFVTNLTTDENIKISAADTTTGKLNDKLVVSSGANTATILETSILNPAGNEDLQIQIDETKINHNNLLNTHNLTTNIDHGTISGLTDDDHARYANLDGRAGGQTLTGGTAASEDLTLVSTSNATKGSILFGTSEYDEVNNRLGVGVTSPATTVSIAPGGALGPTNPCTITMANTGYTAPSNVNTESNGDKVVFYNDASYKFALGLAAQTMWFQATDSTGAGDGKFVFYDGAAGTPVELLTMGVNYGWVWNETGVDSDCRWETSGDANTLFIDGGTDRIAIGNNAPDTILHITQADATPVIRLERNQAAISTDDIVGRIEIETQDTTDPGVCAKLEAISCGTSGETGWRFTGGTPSVQNEFLRIDSDGNVGIGVTEPDALLHVESPTGGVFRLTRKDSAVGDGDILGRIEFENQDSDDDGVAAFINASAAGAAGESELTFGTGTPTSVTERVRIDNLGNVGINITSPLSKLDISGSMGWKVTTVDGDTLLDETHNVVLCNKATALAITLPTATSSTNRVYTIKNINVGAVTITPNGAETIDGAASQSIAVQWSSLTIVSNGTAWFII